MNKEDVFVVIKKNILNVLPKLNPEEIRPEYSMRDLGANSVDRMDVVVQCMADMSIKIPLVEFGRLSSIGELADLLYEKIQQ